MSFKTELERLNAERFEIDNFVKNTSQSLKDLAFVVLRKNEESKAYPKLSFEYPKETNVFIIGEYDKTQIFLVGALDEKTRDTVKFEIRIMIDPNNPKSKSFNHEIGIVVNSANPAVFKNAVNELFDKLLSDGYFDTMIKKYKKIVALTPKTEFVKSKSPFASNKTK
jgi:hypothetical protein